MQRAHFDAMQPQCPVCLTNNVGSSRLVIASVDRGNDDHIFEGVLHCSNQQCQREYPIIDGIPILVRDLRQYLADQVLHVYGREDLSARTESILGDCCGTGSAFDVIRQQLSSYTWDHYGQHDPAESSDPEQSPPPPTPGSILRVLQFGLELSGDPPAGPILDLGCSVGGSTFALAERYDQPVLGIDLNFSMLRLATRVRDQGIVSYPRRRVGLVYDRREFPIAVQQPQRVDFWACDAAALPFDSASFSLAVSLNLLDCVQSPADFLSAITGVLDDRGILLLACPFDWSVSATPLECWLGGHSQRSPDRGSSELVLQRLIAGQTDASSSGRLEVMAQRDAHWQVRMHDRSIVSYNSHLVVAKKVQRDSTTADS